MKIAIIVILNVLLVNGAIAQPAQPADFQKLAPYLEEGTFAVFRLDPERVQPDAVVKYFAEAGGLAPDEPLAQNLQKLLAAPRQWRADYLAAGGGKIYVFFNQVDLPAPFMLAELGANADVEKLRGLFNKKVLIYFETVERQGDFLFAGRTQTRERLQSGKPAVRPDLAAGWASLGIWAISGVIAPPADMRRVLEEALPQLPAFLGGGPVSTFTQRVAWGTFGVNPPPHLGLQLTLEGQRPPGTPAEVPVRSNDLADALVRIENALVNNPQFKPIIPDPAQVLRLLQPRPEGNQTVIRLDEAGADTIARAILAPMVK